MNFNKLFFPHDQKAEHIKSLDGLRGIAVLMVVIAHSHHVNGIHHFFGFYGRVGVYLFFILSAYLLDRQIISMLISNSSNKKYWLNYTLRRILRIYPLFFCALVLYYLLNRNYLGTQITSIEVILKNLSLQRGSGVFWSIPVEFKYYIISPFLMYGFHQFYKWKLSYVIPTIFAVILLSFGIQIFKELDWNSTFKSAPAFLVGSTIAILEKFKENYRYIDKRLLVIISIAGLVTVNPIFWDSFEMTYWYRDLFKGFSIPFFLGILLILSSHGWFRRILETRILRFIGTISFSVYVFHLLIAWGLRKYSDAPEAVNLALYGVLTVIFSSITFLLVEYPVSKISIKTLISLKGKKKPIPVAVRKGL